MKTKTNTKSGATFNHNESMKVRSSIKAGKPITHDLKDFNHNESMKVRTSVKAGGVISIAIQKGGAGKTTTGSNHNEKLVTKGSAKDIVRSHDAAIKVKSSLKAGSYPVTMDPLPWMGKR